MHACAGVRWPGKCCILLLLWQESFDVILEQNSLESATEALANYLESYLKAIHHYGDHGKGDRQFSPPPPLMSLKTNEAKPLPPMIPGRPGLNIAFAVGLLKPFIRGAGFVWCSAVMA